MVTKMTKRIRRGFKSLSVWEHGLRNRQASTKGMTIIAKVLVASWYGWFSVQQMKEEGRGKREEAVSKVLSLAGRNSGAVRG